MRFLSAAMLLAASAQAHAGFPDDIGLTTMSSWDGDEVGNTTVLRESYDDVVRQLAVGIVNKPLAPAETLGISGFDVGLSHTLGFIDAKGADRTHPAPWERVHAEGSPTRILWVPAISVRKGLPLSLEVGANFGYIAFSRQTAIGGFGRWAILEGYRNAPDITMQLGYTGYVGNEELELGVADWSTSIGYSLPFGYLKGINQSTFSPYAGLGVMKINAAPRLSTEDQESLGVRAVSGFKKKDSFTEGFAPLTTHLGVRLRSGDFHMSMATTLVPKVMPTLSTNMGFIY